MINIIEKRRIPFAISGVLFLVSVVLLATIGLKPGIDFTGGTLMELSFTGERPTLSEMQQEVDALDIGSVLVQPVDTDGYLLKTRFLTEEEHQQVLLEVRAAFESAGTQPGLSITDNTSGAIAGGVSVKTADDNRVLEQRIETIGPSISSELRKKSIETGIAVIVAIVLFVAYSFRKVTRPVSSWKYGITAIIALIHDVTITMGVFVLLGHYLGVEVGIPFVVAMLTILGYSVNDTIVVFDRIREKLILRGRDRFAETVNQGVNDTIPRSINTSFTTLLVLIALVLFGGASIHYFALALIIGVFVGTYSSIFLASPLLVVWERWGHRK